jgi:hypothetical protein
MNRLTWSFALLATTSVAILSPLACGGGDISGDTSNGEGGSTSTSSGQGGTGGLFTGSGGSVPHMPLAVMPKSASIDVVDGVASPVQLTATQDGNNVNAKWLADYSSVATVDGKGLVTAVGAKGGLVTVSATVGQETASSAVTVTWKKHDNTANATPAQIDLLTNANAADPAVQWAYPYDKTVFPKGLLPPEMMWNGGAAGDLYLVHVTGQYLDYQLITSADPPARVSIDPTVWKAISESGHGGDVKVHVARLAAGAATGTVVADHTWTIARGSLRGTVYYWANSLGRVVRIKPGAAAPDDFLAAAGVNDGCSTCHTVSANGQTLVIGGDTSTSTFDLLGNKSAFSTTSVGKPVRNWAMPAVSPNGDVLVENNAPLPGPPGGSDGMWNTKAGTKYANTGLEGQFLDMPAFGPAGTFLAYVDHQNHGLGVFSYDSQMVRVSNPVSLVPQGADPNTNLIAFPSVSPTTQGMGGEATWVVYHRGVYPNSLDTRNGPGNLYLASVDQPGMEARLANANGDNYPFAAGDRDRNLNYEPTFDPEPSGGYNWVIFTSRRTYGNRLTGNSKQVKQLWVTALDSNAKPGTDSSHPAFWVPGQDPNTLNMRGYWANDPCKPTGQVCGADSECCNSNCGPGGTCDGPDPNGCVDDGDVCQTKADCCDTAADCIGGTCQTPPPK